MSQDEIISKIHNRIAKKIDKLSLDLEKVGDENEILKATEMFRDFAGKLNGLRIRFNPEMLKLFVRRLGYPESQLKRVKPDEIYEVLREILKELKFEQDEINELMSLIKKLDREHLEELLGTLGDEFFRASLMLEDLPEELRDYYDEDDDEELEMLKEIFGTEEYDDEELEAHNG